LDGQIMLQSLSQDIRDCYRRAAECRARAERATDAAERSSALEEADAWLRQARRRETALQDMTPEPALHPALPRVMCPECGAHMRLDRIVPCATPERRAETVSFSCDCLFTLQQTIDRVD
jgi:hypothetical protein